MNIDKYEDMVLNATSLPQEKSKWQQFCGFVFGGSVFASLVLVVIFIVENPTQTGFEEDFSDFVVADSYLYLTSLQL